MSRRTSSRTSRPPEFLYSAVRERSGRYGVTVRRLPHLLGYFRADTRREAFAMADAALEFLQRRWERLEADRLAKEAIVLAPVLKRRAERNRWFSRRRQFDPGFRLNCNVRAGVYRSLAGAKGGASWEPLVGYTLADLRAHLEPLLTDGMTWANYGEWHVDHVRPLASFNITDAECNDFKAAWALSNLQPLWAQDNLRKGARVPAVVHARCCHGSGVLREATDTPQVLGDG